MLDYYSCRKPYKLKFINDEPPLRSGQYWIVDKDGVLVLPVFHDGDFVCWMLREINKLQDDSSVG